MNAGSFKRAILRPRSWLATMLAVVAAVLLYNWMQQEPAQAAPVVFREGAGPTAPALPLWKPEPSLLIEHAEIIGLTAGQQSAVGEVQAAWDKEKEALERLMAAVIEERGLEEGQAGSHQEIAQGLAGYSELSREYDFRREAFWRSALELLDDAQLELVEALR